MEEEGDRWEWGDKKRRWRGNYVSYVKQRRKSINLKKKKHRSLPFMASSSCNHVVFIHLN